MYKINDINYNIVKLDYNSDHHKLAILHYKEDGMYYVTVFDFSTFQIDFEVVLDLSFSTYILHSLTKYPNFEAYVKYYNVNDDVSRKFRQLKSFGIFQIGFWKERNFNFWQDYRIWI